MNIIYKWLIDNNMKQQELGEKVGAKKQQFNSWIKGTYRPSFEIILKLHEYTGISCKELLKGFIEIKKPG